MGEGGEEPGESLIFKAFQRLGLDFVNREA